MNKPRAKRGYFIINNKKHHVYDGINIIGRNKEAAVIIKENIVSHQHAILVITKRHHYLSDTKSFNGTFVGDTKLIPFHLHYLTNKATVKFATLNSTYFFIEDEGIIVENTHSEIVDDSIYCCKTQRYDSDVSANVQSELIKRQEQAISFHDTDDSPMQVINLNDSSGYDNGNLKSNNESVFNSINIIDESVINDSITNRNEKVSEPEVCYKNRTNSVDFMTMQPTSQYSTKSADTDSQSHTSQLSKKKLNFGGRREQNEEETNETMHKGTKLSDETDFEDITKQKKNDTEFQAPVSGVSKRKRNIITSDEKDSCEIITKFGKKESHMQVIMSDDEIKKHNAVKRKSAESTDDTKVEIETLQKKKIGMTVVGDNTQVSSDSLLDDTDRESERNSSGISGRKKTSFITHQSNKNSNLFKNDVIGEKQCERRSETDMENIDAKNEEANEGTNALNDKLNDTQVIPETPNLSEGETNFGFNAQANPRASKFRSRKKKLQSDLFLLPAQKQKFLNAAAKENELNSSNNSDTIQATPDCFEDEIRFEFNAEDIKSKANKFEKCIEGTNPTQGTYSKSNHKSQGVLLNESINSEQSVTESFHLDLNCSIHTESNIIHKGTKPTQKLVAIDNANLIFNEMESKIVANDVYLQPTKSQQKLPPCDGNLLPEKQEVVLIAENFDKINDTNNNNEVKNNDETGNKAMDRSPVFLQPTEKIAQNAYDNDIFLQPTQQLSLSYKVQKRGVNLYPIQKLDDFTLEEDDDTFLQPTKQLSLPGTTSGNSKDHLKQITQNPRQPDSGAYTKKFEANEAPVDPSPAKVLEKIKQVESQLDASQKVENAKKPIRRQAKATRKTRSGKRAIDEYVGATLRRRRGNSATDDGTINNSIMNNNNNETMNSIDESGITQFTELGKMRNNEGNKPTNVELMNDHKSIAERDISTKQLRVVDDATEKPTNDVNSALTQDSIDIDKHLKKFPQNETTRITRTKRKLMKNKMPHEDDANVDQSTDKSRIHLNNFITNTDRNEKNSSKIKSLPSTATDHNREESSASDDDFFVKAPRSSKCRISNNDTSRGGKVQEIDITEKHDSIQNPKVAFTMLHSPELESVIRSLGGSIVDTIDACTVLLTGCVKRSQKLLSAVGQGKPICSPKWLLESKKSGKFIDPWDYILEDDEAEHKWTFSLRESLNRSTNKKLLEDYSCQLVVNNGQDALKGAIESCGGKCVTRAPPKNSTATLVVVASPENRAKYAKFLKRNPRPLIVTTEAIFDGVLRQELNFEDYVLT